MNDATSSFPDLQDDGGYQLQPRDAGFVGASPDSLHAVAARAYPLGFSSREEWLLCMAELREVVEQDGLADADRRLKGTAAAFFSRNPEKAFPKSAAVCRAQAEANGLDGTAAEGRWSRSPYAEAGIIPTRAFWDSRYELGIDSERSDYDIQVSSDALAETVRARYPDGMYRGRSIVSAHGGHFTHAVLLRTFPALAAWSERWQTRLGRKVNLAGFPAAGPDNPISRFQDDDWVIIP